MSRHRAHTASRVQGVKEGKDHTWKIKRQTDKKQTTNRWTAKNTMLCTHCKNAEIESLRPTWSFADSAQEKSEEGWRVVFDKEMRNRIVGIEFLKVNTRLS